MGFVYWRVVEDVPGERLRLERSDDPRRQMTWDRTDGGLRTRYPTLGGLFTRETWRGFSRTSSVSFTLFPERPVGPYIVRFAVEHARPMRGVLILGHVRAPLPGALVLFKIARIVGWEGYRVTPAEHDGIVVEVREATAEPGAGHPFREAASDDLLAPTGRLRRLPSTLPPEPPPQAKGGRFVEPGFPVGAVAAGMRFGTWRLARWRPPRSILLVEEPPGIWRILGRWVPERSRHARHSACFDARRGVFRFRSGRRLTSVPLEDVLHLRLRTRHPTSPTSPWELQVERRLGRVTVAETEPGEGPGTEPFHRLRSLLIALARALDVSWSVDEGSAPAEPVAPS